MKIIFRIIEFLQDLILGITAEKCYCSICFYSREKDRTLDKA